MDSNTTSKLNVGVVGCGWFGNFHIDNLLKMDDVNVCALATENFERMKNTAKKTGDVGRYRAGEYMMSAYERQYGEKLDAAVICATPARHGELEKTAADFGVNLYVEKPIGLSMDEVQRNIEAIEKSGIIVSVGYQGRYDPAMNEIKKFLHGRKIGVVEGKWIGNMPQTPWWREKQSSGGQLVEQCTHIVDILRYLVGEITSVYCKGMTGIMQNIPNYSVEDATIATVTFQNGAVGSITSACFLDTAKTPSDIGFKIYCDDGRVECDWGREVRLITADRVTVIPLSPSAHFLAMREFLNAVKENDKTRILSPYSDAAKTLAVTLAANKSMETGEVISL